MPRTLTGRHPPGGRAPCAAAPEAGAAASRWNGPLPWPLTGFCSSAEHPAAGKFTSSSSPCGAVCGRVSVRPGARGSLPVAAGAGAGPSGRCSLPAGGSGQPGAWAEAQGAPPMTTPCSRLGEGRGSLSFSFVGLCI